MSVFTPTFYPAGPLTAAYAHLSTYVPKQDGTFTVPFAGRGKLVHAEAITLTVQASTAQGMEIQNDNGTAIGDITIATTTSAVGDETEWVPDASSESDYTIDNGHIQIVMASQGSAGAAMVYFILEPANA